jgi:hypothetical protein
LASFATGILAPTFTSVKAAQVNSVHSVHSASPICGLTLAQWTFDQASISTTNPAPSTANVTAAASENGVGSVGFTSTGSHSGKAWSGSGWSTTSTPNTTYFEFDVDSTNYSSLSMSFYASRSNTGPTKVSVQYSADGTTFTSINTYSIPVVASGNTTSQTNIDLSSITSLNDNANAKFRIYGINSTGGTLRIDDVTFTGCSMPVVIDNITPNPTNSGATITWHAWKNGAYEVRLGGTNCADGTVIDSGSYSTSPNKITSSINATNLVVDQSYALFVCVTASSITDFAFSSITKDTTSPSVVISLASSQANTTTTLPINFTVAFSEPINVSTFTTADITQNGTATGITWSIIDSGDHTNFTLSAAAVPSSGTVTPSIDTGKVTDLAGNPNVASNTDAQVTFTLPPQPTPCPISYHSLLINEVGWMGTEASSSDEWVELYNPTACDIVLTGWTLDGANSDSDSGNFSLDLTGITIPSGGYFVIASNNNVFNAATKPALFKAYSDLVLLNHYQSLALSRPNSYFPVDTANYDGNQNWPAGTASPNYASMERYHQLDDGPAAWVTFAGPLGTSTTNVKDRSGNYIHGTPGKPNWANTVTLTPSPIPTSTPKPRAPTPKPPTPFAHMVINEFVPRPGFDWNNDDVVDTNDEFIEIENLGPVSVNLSGWKLSDINNQTFSLPGQTLNSGQRAVFYGSTTHIVLFDSGDTIRLINARGIIVDAQSYDVAKYPDQSWCRFPDGSWYWQSDCVPTPGNENSLTGVIPSPPPPKPDQSLPCLLPDNAPTEFILAECNAYGQNIWNRGYWDHAGGQNEFILPDPFSKDNIIIQ